MKRISPTIFLRIFSGLLCLFPLLRAAPVLDLSGEWTVTLPQGKKISADLPGDIYTALMDAGELEDPYVQQNEKDAQWVGGVDWIYTRTVDVTEDFLAHDQVFFNAECLDTFVDVLINGEQIGSAGTMFHRHRFDAKPFLKAGENEIRLVFRSAQKEARRRAEQQSYFVPYTGNNTIPYMNLIRKAQCHAGWDWGISLSGVGALGDLSLRAVNSGRVEHVTTTQTFRGGDCLLTVEVELLAPVAGQSELQVRLDGQEQRQKVILQPGINRVHTQLEVKSPRRWWPSGYGEQTLYDLEVNICGQTVRKKIGFRELEVVHELDETLTHPAVEGQTLGKGLSLRVNGVDVFAKGANWIPADALLSRQTPERYRSLLTAARDANMNMIRVWGGGQFEQDAFYELCDELGLLIWHDMMFACSLYPATPEYLAEVKAEVRYQAKRLRDHPSLALWCGDNEVFQAFGWYKTSRTNRDRHMMDYTRLNDLLRHTLAEADPGRFFWPGSPITDPVDFSVKYKSLLAGDMHFWDVWHGNKPFSAFVEVTPRFCSEFGFQSFPLRNTLDAYIPEASRNVFSPDMEHHQRSRGGNARILNTFSRYFRMPVSFEGQLYLSQVQQALAIKTAVEAWRSRKPVCMGTLYWQLNDNWPVASWSSIDYEGRWKQLHHHARRFYAPAIGALVIVPEVPPEEKEPEEPTKLEKLLQEPEPDPELFLQVWAVSDLPVRTNLRATLELRDFDGKVVHQFRFRERVSANGSLLLKELNLSEFDRPPEELFATLTTEFRSDDQTQRHVNSLFLTAPKDCPLRPANIQTEVLEDEAGLQVRLTADAPAFFVTLGSGEIRGEFEDNSFTLLPGEPRTVRFRSESGSTTSGALRFMLQVQHLQAVTRR